MYAGLHPDTAFADLPLVSTAADESDLSPIVRRARPRVAAPGAAVLLRAALAFMTFAAIGALAIPAMAEPGAQQAAVEDEAGEAVAKEKRRCGRLG